MTWNHPELGEIFPLFSDVRAEKTWKHFYAPKERWDDFEDVDRDRLLSSSRTYGCPEWSESREMPAGGSCPGKVATHHDVHWRPIYEKEFARSTTCSAPSISEPGVWAFLSKSGIYGVLVEKERSFKSVYRPHARGLRVIPSIADIWHTGCRRFYRETGLSMSTLHQDLALVPSTAPELWRLALAIDEARHGNDDSLSEPLELAERHLENASAELRAEATPATSPLLDHLEAAISGDENDLTGVLLSLEEALIVTGVLGGESAARSLLDELSGLLDWMPATWTTTRTLIDSQAGVRSPIARAWWNLVDEALDAAVLHAAEPLHLPKPSLTSKVLPEPWLPPLLARARARLSGILMPRPTMPDGWRLGASALSSAKAGALELTPPPELATSGARVFLVDSDHPGGEELTDDLALGSIWELDQPGEQAVVIIVHGVEGATLEEVLQAAESAPGARVVPFPISRPR